MPCDDVLGISGSTSGKLKGLKMPRTEQLTGFSTSTYVRVYMYHPDHPTPITVCICVCTQYPIPGIMAEKKIILWLMWHVCVLLVKI